MLPPNVRIVGNVYEIVVLLLHKLAACHFLGCPPADSWVRYFLHVTPNISEKFTFYQYFVHLLPEKYISKAQICVSYVFLLLHSRNCQLLRYPDQKKVRALSSGQFVRLLIGSAFLGGCIVLVAHILLRIHFIAFLLLLSGFRPACAVVDYSRNLTLL